MERVNKGRQFSWLERHFTLKISTSIYVLFFIRAVVFVLGIMLNIRVFFVGGESGRLLAGMTSSRFTNWGSGPDLMASEISLGEPLGNNPLD